MGVKAGLHEGSKLTRRRYGLTYMRIWNWGASLWGDSVCLFLALRLPQAAPPYPGILQGPRGGVGNGEWGWGDDAMHVAPPCRGAFPAVPPLECPISPFFGPPFQFRLRGVDRM